MEWNYGNMDATDDAPAPCLLKLILLPTGLFQFHKSELQTHKKYS
jgi:hypothetical protein